MANRNRQELVTKLQHQLRWFTYTLVGILTTVAALVLAQINGWELQKEPIVTAQAVGVEEDMPEFGNGIHLATGLIEDDNVRLIIGNCTSCHSAKMVTQNRATRDGWKAMIKWMQETQGLWDLGDNEPLILDYLAKHYAPNKQGRRAPLTNIAWYELED